MYIYICCCECVSVQVKCVTQYKLVHALKKQNKIKIYIYIFHFQNENIFATSIFKYKFNNTTNILIYYCV